MAIFSSSKAFSIYSTSQVQLLSFNCAHRQVALQTTHMSSSDWLRRTFKEYDRLSRSSSRSVLACIASGGALRKLAFQIVNKSHHPPNLRRSFAIRQLSISAYKTCSAHLYQQLLHSWPSCNFSLPRLLPATSRLLLPKRRLRPLSAKAITAQGLGLKIANSAHPTLSCLLHSRVHSAISLDHRSRPFVTVQTTICKHVRDPRRPFSLPALSNFPADLRRDTLSSALCSTRRSI